MKKLHKLVLKSYIGPLFVTYFISHFVLLMQFIWKYASELAGKGIEWYIIAELLLYASAGIVQMALPLAVLLASIMTFGALGENYELTAMKAAGISLQRIMAPLITLNALLMVGALVFSNYVVPDANLRLGALLASITRQRPEMNIENGVFNNDITGYSIRVMDKSKDGKMMYDFMIYDHTVRRGNHTVILADSGQMRVTPDEKYLLLHLYNGVRYTELPEETRPAKREKTYPRLKDEFQEESIILELSGFNFQEVDMSLFKNHYRMKALGELSTAIDSLNEVNEKRAFNFKTTILINFYYKYGRHRINPSKEIITKDSLISLIPGEQLPVPYNFDSAFAVLPEVDLIRTLNIAKDYAHNVFIQTQHHKDDYLGRKRWAARYANEWHRKFTLSLACLIFFFVGAPLGAIIRKGGLGLPLVVSILVFILYYVISMFGEKAGREGALDPSIGMWISTYIILPLGIFLTYKATTDSTLFDADAYINKLKYMFGFAKKAKNKIKKRK